MKHYRLLSPSWSVLGLLAAACGDDGGGDDGRWRHRHARHADLPTEVGEGEGALNIVAWPGYIEDGSTDPGLRLGDAASRTRPAVRSR